jgi:hypothetical protein
VKRALIVLCAPAWLAAQQGLTPTWEVQKVIDTLASSATRIVSTADDLRPEEWTRKGAPATYMELARSLRDELGHVRRAAEQLKRDPEQLTLAMETYFRLQSLETVLGSLSHGVRKYQNPALADLLEGMIAENETNRAKFRNYVVELSGSKEAELRIMNEEAQRCRGALIRESAGTRKRGESRRAKQ